jgi:PhoH-like ATPase
MSRARLQPLNLPVARRWPAPRGAPAPPVPAQWRHPAPAPARRSARKAACQGPAKLFVLDTNVLLHDPTSLFRFEEHDIFLPMIVLEELDGHKKGMTEVARNGRQTSRTLDALAGAQGADIAQGLKLDSTGQREAGGTCSSRRSRWTTACPPACPRARPTTRFWAWWRRCASSMPARSGAGVQRHQHARQGARPGPAAEDYQNDKTLEDGDLLYPACCLPPDFWAASGKNVESWQAARTPSTASAAPSCRSLMINQFVYFEAPGEPSLYARVSEIRGKTAVLQDAQGLRFTSRTPCGA